MTDESLIASHVYSRKLDKPRNVWPAVIVTALVGVGVIAAYSLAQMRGDSRVFDPSELLNSRFLFSLVPCGVLAVALWAGLYFGYVRSRNASMGPASFNVIAIAIFATSVLAPMSVHGVWYVEKQIALGKARKAWDAEPELKAELLAIAASERAADAAAIAALKPHYEATERMLVISPITIASQADVQTASARLRKTLDLMEQTTTEDAARQARTKAAIDAAVRKADAPALVRDHIYARLAADEQAAAAAGNVRTDLRRSTYEETLAALDVLRAARGLWESDGEKLFFARQSDIDELESHLRNAKLTRYDLHHQPAERLPAQSWARPPKGV